MRSHVLRQIVHETDTKWSGHSTSSSCNRLSTRGRGDKTHLVYHHTIRMREFLEFIGMGYFHLWAKFTKFIKRCPHIWCWNFASSMKNTKEFFHTIDSSNWFWYYFFRVKRTGAPYKRVLHWIGAFSIIFLAVPRAKFLQLMRNSCFSRWEAWSFAKSRGRDNT